MKFHFEKHTRALRHMKVKQLMGNRKLITVDKDTSIPELLVFFEKHNVRDFPVVDENRELIGDVAIEDILPFAIDPEDISEHEVIGVLGTELHDIFGNSVEDIMRFHEETVMPDDMVSDIALQLWKNDIRVVSVVDGNKLVGIISQKDIIDLLAKTLVAVKPKKSVKK